MQRSAKSSGVCPMHPSISLETHPSLELYGFAVSASLSPSQEGSFNTRASFLILISQDSHLRSHLSLLPISSLPHSYAREVLQLQPEFRQ